MAEPPKPGTENIGLARAVRSTIANVPCFGHSVWMTLASPARLVDTSFGMEPSGPETSARPRALLGGVTLLIALTLSVRVLDAAYVVPAFRPIVAQAAVRLLASAGELEAHRPVAVALPGCLSLVSARSDGGGPCDTVETGSVDLLRSELLSLPPPGCVRA